MSEPVDNQDVGWHREPCIVGIDEAGRGPVLGPMIYTAAYCAKSKVPELNALGADDSKQLSEEQRDKLRKKIDSAPFLSSVTTVLSAQELSEKMLRRAKYNLNLISHDTALQLVENILAQGVNVTEVFVDTVGDPSRYAAKFKDRFPALEKVVVAKKADSTYRIVGAASIVAKTTRDHHIREWIFPEQERSAHFAATDPNLSVALLGPTGSGYPSDPTTKAWMASNCDFIFGFPSLVRFSWGTARLLMLKKSVAVAWECDEDEADETSSAQKAVKTKDIKSFFAAKSDAKSCGRSMKRRKLKTAANPMPKRLASLSLERTETLL